MVEDLSMRFSRGWLEQYLTLIKYWPTMSRSQYYLRCRCIHLQNYLHQHQPKTAFWLVFIRFTYRNFCLNIGHYVTNIGKSWCTDVVSQTLLLFCLLSLFRVISDWSNFWHRSNIGPPWADPNISWGAAAAFAKLSSSTSANNRILVGVH